LVFCLLLICFHNSPFFLASTIKPTMANTTNTGNGRDPEFITRTLHKAHARGVLQYALNFSGIFTVV